MNCTVQKHCITLLYQSLQVINSRSHRWSELYVSNCKIRELQTLRITWFILWFHHESNRSVNTVFIMVSPGSAFQAFMYVYGWSLFRRRPFAGTLSFLVIISFLIWHVPQKCITSRLYLLYLHFLLFPLSISLVFSFLSFAWWCVQETVQFLVLSHQQTGHVVSFGTYKSFCDCSCVNP